MENRSEEIAIDVRRMLVLTLHKLWILGIAAVCCAGVAFLMGRFWVTPQYQASALFYVNNSAASEQSISAEDIEAAKNLVDAYGVLLNTKATLEAVIDQTGVDRTYEALQQMISAESVRSTELLEITVTSPTPQEADKLIEGIVEILPRQAAAIMEGASAQLADIVPAGTEPVSPNVAVYTLVGFLLGAFLSGGGLLLWALLDKKLRFPSDIGALCQYPVLEVREDPEASKILRAKLPHAIKTQADCPVIGVVSCGKAQPGLAETLSRTLAASGKQVLLIDCDFGKASSVKGLAEILSEQIPPEEGICPCGERQIFWKIGPGKAAASAEHPDGTAMENLLTLLKKRYSAILLALPRTGDALTAAPWTDGFLLTACRNQSSKETLKTMVRDLEFVGAKINAVLFDCSRTIKACEKISK